MMASRDYLARLMEGDRVFIDQGSAGVKRGKVARVTPKLFFVRIGKELRRFCRSDGGTFQSPTMSKSWIVQEHQQ